MIATFEKSGPIRGNIRVPGDKSISHRALLFAAMADGISLIENMTKGADVASTARCLAALGVPIDLGQASARVRGMGWQPTGAVDLDCGNSGTTMRLLTGALAAVPSSFTLRGDRSLSRRPMDQVAEPLREMGASLSLKEGRFPPVMLRGGELKAIDHKAKVTSAQLKSAVLLAGLGADGMTSFTEPRPTRDHTERMLKAFGASIETSGTTVKVRGGGRLHPFRINVPGDISSAAFHVAAACLVEGSRLVVEDVGLNQTRMGFIDAVRKMGAGVETEVLSDEPEPVGNLTVTRSALSAITLAGDEVPRTIDEVPLVALLATQAEGTTSISDAAELREKETDRIETIAASLSSLGATVDVKSDGLLVHGPTALKGGRVDAGGDHRIAMMLAVAGLVSNEPVTIEGWDCVDISYPSFADDLRALLT